MTFLDWLGSPEAIGIRFLFLVCLDLLALAMCIGMSWLAGSSTRALKHANQLLAERKQLIENLQARVKSLETEVAKCEPLHVKWSNLETALTKFLKVPVHSHKGDVNGEFLVAMRDLRMALDGEHHAHR